jgi:hypothetical protein
LWASGLTAGSAIVDVVVDVGSAVDVDAGSASHILVVAVRFATSALLVFAVLVVFPAV